MRQSAAQSAAVEAVTKVTRRGRELTGKRGMDASRFSSEFIIRIASAPASI